MQVYQSEEDHVYLVDVHTLGAAAFSTTATDGITTLKSVLENSSIPKAFFDVRNDSDALYNLYSIYLCGVVDVQLMELPQRFHVALTRVQSRQRSQKAFTPSRV